MGSARVFQSVDRLFNSMAAKTSRAPDSGQIHPDNHSSERRVKLAQRQYPAVNAARLAAPSIAVSRLRLRHSVMPLRTYAYPKPLAPWLEVGDERFSSSEIQRLYEAEDYPLRKPE